MDEEDRQIRQKLKDDFPYYASRCLKIRTKAGSIVPLVMNKAQQYTHDKIEEQKLRTGKVRVLVLKGRQQGMSTYIGGRFYHITSHHYGIQAFILTHLEDATTNLYEMVQRYYELTPEAVKCSTSKSNAKQLIFGALHSGYKLGTAKNKSLGRSSTIQLFHGCLSEDSLIVLADGSTKSMGDIEVRDLVLTSSGAVAPVSNKIYTGEKQTYTLKCWGSGEAIHLTADHKVLTSEGYKEVKDLLTTDYVAMPKIKPTGKISSYKFGVTNTARPQGGGSKHIEDFTFSLNYDFGYLLGYYLAEGHVKDNLGYITFAYHEDETYIHKALRGTFGLETSVRHQDYPDSKRKHTHVYGKFLTSAVNQICGRVQKKRIPEWFFATNKEFLKGVLQGYLDGDGSKTQLDKIAASSIHEKISRQIQRICWCLCGAASISKHKRKRYDVPTKDIYLVRICGNALNKLRGAEPNTRKEKSFVKDDTVYCRIKSVTPRKIERVWDIEVDHSDHDYQTTTGIVSNSEVAFWEHAADHAKGVLQAIPNAKGTEVILESTANGVGNYFHQMWQQAESGDSDFIAIFVPWFWQEEYSIPIDATFVATQEEMVLSSQYSLSYEQINWRRGKVRELGVNGADGVKSFKQEYPCNPQEAFQLTGEDSYIESDVVMRARKAEVEGYGPLVFGVDPARFGDDRTCILMRQGRKVPFVETHSKKDTMEVTGIVDTLIREHKPSRVFVDVGGLGAGVVDRLKELGHDEILVAVNAGSRPRDANRYYNKRAEMWGSLHDWLDDAMPCDIPDSDELHADICNIKYKIDSSSRLVMEQKADMKRRGVRSPDMADALCLTFAMPEGALAGTINKKRANILATLAKGQAERSKAISQLGRK